MENGRFTPLDKVKQRVVGRIKASDDGKCVFHVHADPVAEGHFLPRISTKRKIPLREIPKKERSSWLEGADHFIDPSPAPPTVFIVGDIVADFALLELSQVKGGISKGEVYCFTFDGFQDFYTVSFKQLAELSP